MQIRNTRYLPVALVRGGKRDLKGEICIRLALMGKDLRDSRPIFLIDVQRSDLTETQIAQPDTR